MTIKEKKLLYHLTTLDAFESIVEHGLISRKGLKSLNLNFIDTANHEILEGRERHDLNNYIPFHFHIHTKYDTYIKDHYRENDLIYLCIHRDFARENGFIILPIHPTATEQPNVYAYDEGIEVIDWDVMELKKTDALPKGVDERYRVQVRMAECLSPRTLQIEDFFSIIVKDNKSKDIVERVLKKYDIKRTPYIDVIPQMF